MSGSLGIDIEPALNLNQFLRHNLVHALQKQGGGAGCHMRVM